MICRNSFLQAAENSRLNIPHTVGLSSHDPVLVRFYLTGQGDFVFPRVIKASISNGVGAFLCRNSKEEDHAVSQLGQVSFQIQEYLGADSGYFSFVITPQAVKIYRLQVKRTKVMVHLCELTRLVANKVLIVEDACPRLVRNTMGTIRPWAQKHLKKDSFTLDFCLRQDEEVVLIGVSD